MTNTTTRVHLDAEGAIALDLVVLDCATCSVIFAITKDFDARRRYDGAGFHCPAGHSNVYKASDREKLERRVEELERKNRVLDRSLSEREVMLAAERRQHAATKGQVTKLRKRAAAGVCAWCHRHFANVERHVATKHPGQGAAAEDA